MTFPRNPRPPGRLARPLVLAVAVALALPAGAGARGLTTGFFDDAFATGGEAGALRLDEARASGAGIVRIPVRWPAVAPARPARARDPGDPAYRWQHVDAGVAAARARGLDVVLSIFTAPAWAQGRRRPARFAAGSWKPDPEAAGDFATALARRYAGQAGFVQLWNEPNLALHLSPQWERRRGALRPFAPRHYRGMLNAAYPGVRAAGVRLVTAGTAPYGDPGTGGNRLRPARFWRGVMASKVRFDILAHHPYGVGGPRRKALHRDDVAIPDVQKLTRLVRDAVRAGRLLPRERKRYWVTELSWDSSPPDPDGVPARRHATWLGGAFHELWRDGVDTVTWFQVRDAPPDPGYDTTYQSGVYFRDGRPKPAQRAFAFPVSCRRAGARTRLWALVPSAGTATVEGTDGRPLRRVASGADRVVTATLRGRGAFRVVAGGVRSLACRS